MNQNLQSGIVCKIQGQAIHFAYSDHFLHRKSQRAINQGMINAVLEYGEAYFKQGLIFYVLGSKMSSLKKEMNKDLNHFNNIVLLVSKDTNQIITGYRNSNPFKYVKKKAKRNKH